ncbi:MAG: MFS transporter [Dehalobacterium sp.]
MLKNFSLQEKSWIMYDWANSAYSVIVTATILPIFFKTMTKDAGISSHMADAYWGYATSLATLLLAVMAPVLGTLGDYRNLKMGMFKVFFVIGVVATAALAFTDQWVYLIIFYVLSIIGFSGANLFYDAFLVDVTSKERMDRVSTYGFALGYIGGSTIPFIIAILLIMFGKNIGIPALLGTKVSFLITAVWWVLFALPLLKNVKQVYFLEREPNLIKNSFKRLFNTLLNVKKYRHIFLFLLAYFFYIDGVNTIIHMATVYGDSVGLGTNTLMLAMLATQIVAFPCAIIYGILAKRFGSSSMILFGIIVYIIICYLAYKMETAFDFWLLAMLVASSQGGIQALSRSYFGKMVPKENANEFFGFYDIFGKFAAIMGPALYGLFSQLTGQSRYGVLSVMILFVIGGGIFIFSLRDTRGRV